MQLEDIYRFEVQYVNEKEQITSKIFYSVNPDIYSLENLPETTFHIDVYYLKDLSTIHTAQFRVGTPLTFEELEKEIELTKNSDDTYYHYCLTSAYQKAKDHKNDYFILRKQGKLLCLLRYVYLGDFIGEVKDGKITKENEISIVKNEDGDNYISLE